MTDKKVTVINKADKEFGQPHHGHGPALTPEQRDAKKAGDFKRLAEKRVPKIIKAIRGLYPLASPNYLYTEEQTRKIIVALEAEVIGLGTVLAKKKQDADVGFSL